MNRIQAHISLSFFAAEPELVRGSSSSEVLVTEQKCVVFARHTRGWKKAAL